ncbi:MAG TPA: NAD-dependent epimerase/dehydratase family protein, partial [Thermoanaerobaculia bacterium]|nr:NAD-dependent epimerase/dehydratase family protein [Thermoanaerobaculia bacterium]
MVVLLAGGAGLLGAALGKALLAEGEEVVVADGFDDGGDGRAVKEWRAEALARHPLAAVERVDLTDAAALADLFARRRPAAVVNAALFDPSGSGAGPLMFAARTAGTGLFLHLSDGALYAPGPTPERPAGEEEPLDAGGDPVLAAKAEEERLLAELGLPFVCLRVFRVVGPMFPPRRFPSAALEAILAGETVFYEESGWCDMVHLDDVVGGALLALKRRPLGRTLNLGGGLLALELPAREGLQQVGRQHEDVHAEQEGGVVGEVATKGGRRLVVHVAHGVGQLRGRAAPVAGPRVDDDVPVHGVGDAVRKVLPHRDRA